MRELRLRPQKSRARVDDSVGVESVSALGMDKKSSDLCGVTAAERQSSLKPGLFGLPLFIRKNVVVSLKHKTGQHQSFTAGLRIVYTSNLCFHASNGSKLRSSCFPCTVLEKYFNERLLNHAK